MTKCYRHRLHARCQCGSVWLLTGFATKGTGNALSNYMTGGALNSTLNGGAGDDSLNGQGGDDSLIGGGGQ